MTEKPCMAEGTLVVVRYLDHVLFKNCSSETVKPISREAVGWIVRQNEEAIWVICDRPVGQCGKDCLESGLVLLRKDISELKQFC
jgi:hypothetical protein